VYSIEEVIEVVQVVERVAGQSHVVFVFAGQAVEKDEIGAERVRHPG
jgi:hypothetical protein